MTTSEKFCLNWNDFQENVTTSIKDFRGDFCDITLVSEGHKKIEAHRVILAASSNFFRDIFRQNPHPNPMLFMRGIQDDQLSAVVDFMYHGQTNVAQDDLAGFLQLAAELQLKGLSGAELDPDVYKDSKNVKTRKKINPIDITKLELDKEQNPDHSIIEAKNQMVVEDVINIGENGHLVAYDDVTKARISTTDEHLVETIKSMLEKANGIWFCTQCGQTNRHQSNLKKHIEAKHIDGVSHSCDKCGKQFRSKSDLYNHNSRHHH